MPEFHVPGSALCSNVRGQISIFETTAGESETAQQLDRAPGSCLVEIRDLTPATSKQQLYC